MLDATATLVVAVLCFLVAFVYSNLGLGGGLLLVPILLSFGVGGTAAEPNFVVVPISLTLTVATATAAVLTHRRRGYVDADSAKVLIGGALLGSVAGTAVNTLILTRDTFLVFFTGVLVGFGLLLIREKLQARDEEQDDPTRHTPGRRAAASGTAVGSGFLSGAAGVGGGLINVPILTIILGLRARKAVGTSSLVIVPVAAFGFALTLLINTARGYPLLADDFVLIPILFPVVFVGAFLGSTLGLQRLKSRTVMWIFLSLLFATAAKLVLVDLLRLL